MECVRDRNGWRGKAAGEGGGGGARTLVAQGPAFRFTDSYLSRGEIKKRDQQS